MQANEAEASTPTRPGHLQHGTPQIQLQGRQDRRARRPEFRGSKHQHQPRETRQTSPPRQYTTVGSVYNPQSQPLQPPVRRGRTVKSLFPYKNESPGTPSQLQYTPLQQNYDRAISPNRLGLDSTSSAAPDVVYERQVSQGLSSAASDRIQSPNMAGSPRPPIPNTTNGNASRYQNGQETGNVGASGGPKYAGQPALSIGAFSVSDESDGADTKPVSAMNFNSLTNLASYTNPMQRAARKVLASHRPHHAPATEVSLLVPD